MIVIDVKRKGNSVLVRFDEGESLSVPYDVFLKNYLHVDDEISEKQKEVIEKDSTIYRIKQSSFRYLSGRNHSKYELKLKLQKKNYDVSLIMKVINDLEQQGFINDEIFANDYYNAQLRKKKGLLQIKANLGKKGVRREIIESVTSKLNNDEVFVSNAKIIAEKKINLLLKRNMEYKAIKQKVFQFLASRGFTTNIIMEAINQLEFNNSDE